MLIYKNIFKPKNIQILRHKIKSLSNAVSQKFFSVSLQETYYKYYIHNIVVSSLCQNWKAETKNSRRKSFSLEMENLT